MQRPIPWLWIALAAFLLLAPGLAGRLFIDVLEGVTLLVVVGPLLLAGAGLVAWQLVKRRMTTCLACGTVSFGQSVCPACGSALDSSGTPAASTNHPEVTASDATIDVVAQVVDDD
ncbi:hypothetical protein [Vulcanococcus limneticus]|uniref:hypothetical protein n=1 Tax=Vulcanococcus limneticus TaxID=2170428 RepID=UPI000B99CBBD|nr:hypothetical protein [Vulcanococcus limneticus]MCP9792062.1 hypothetical protein [Vulcanococcus limneticus MW73D5]MCP9893075.1 hypothetical protein [Vulcanococcus limneticus Candia 3F8]MCP9897461.1 hypothetical protein [Vulcanococcus limneticus Candia 3B3]